MCDVYVTSLSTASVSPAFWWRGRVRVLVLHPERVPRYHQIAGHADVKIVNMPGAQASHVEAVNCICRRSLEEADSHALQSRCMPSIHARNELSVLATQQALSNGRRCGRCNNDTNNYSPAAPRTRAAPLNERSRPLLRDPRLHMIERRRVERGGVLARHHRTELRGGVR